MTGVISEMYKEKKELRVITVKFPREIIEYIDKFSSSIGVRRSDVIRVGSLLFAKLMSDREIGETLVILYECRGDPACVIRYIGRDLKVKKILYWQE